MARLSSIKLSLDHHPSYNTCLSLLEELNYTRVQMVLEAGEFAVRGSVVDVYPYNQPQPIRLEYDGEAIERLVSFDCQTQRTYSELTETTIAAFRKIKKKSAFTVKQPVHELLSTFKAGDFVVHESYGIGIFKGLISRKFNDTEGEFLQLDYKDEDKLYVPLDQIHLLHVYANAENPPKLTRLHDGLWDKTKEKTIKSTKKLAEDIYVLQQIRQNQKGHSCGDDTEDQIAFEAEFPYETTPDQAKAIDAVKQDMMDTKPMDRLVCGDVGYGKTEVILRAAFKALENGKQVAVLVPTTLLAQQHYETFLKRLENFPYTLSLFSRFVKKPDQNKRIKGLRTQAIDIVIGTHRLLQKDIIYKDLGLLVVDEEQRFGVAQKEKIKQLKHTVDVLSVSATPIPRTMYLALSGAKDMINIQTPPKNRQPVQTYVYPLTPSIMKSAIKEELKRGGQVFYVYNSVFDIEIKKQEILTSLPDLRIGVAHGQLTEKEIRPIMADFLNHKLDLLLCTTIIENGLDIPNANTIIIDGVERFGLSQVHQLRGRVGRTDRQAYAYMFHTPNHDLSEVAEKRLQALREYVSLGSGYDLALKDLEIRGAGNVLGKEQHGHMISVGFTLYCKLLEEAVAKTHGEAVEPKKVLNISPNDLVALQTLIGSERERLAIYKRVLFLQSHEECDVLYEEIKDRYGKEGEALQALFNHIKDLIDVSAYV